MEEKRYLAIDLKSFYASVECVERGLDPMDTMLVVADPSRTEKTICLAVSPALKAYGIPGRARLFEVIERVREINTLRRQKAPGGVLKGKSHSAAGLSADPSCALDFIIAPPQMAHYMEISTRIYHIYLNYIAPEDIHVYSVDEIFADVTSYLPIYRVTPHELALRMIRRVLRETGITATAGIGTNLYLAKIAMDMVAKRIPADRDGVRIAELDEQSYREQLWSHRPLTDFWRIGPGYAKRLEANGLYTMGDIARCSIGKLGDFHNEDLLYKLFGVQAELLIDHAWGWEPCTIADIKSFKSDNNSISNGQVLTRPYSSEEAEIIVREMTNDLAFSLVEKELVCDQVVLSINYDSQNLKEGPGTSDYKGPVKTDRYGRTTPKPAHGSKNIGRFTSSGRLLTEAMMELFKEIADPGLLVRYIYVIFNHVVAADSAPEKSEAEQRDLFTDYTALEKQEDEIRNKMSQENRLQKSILRLQQKFGKNIVLKGMSLQDSATQKERNAQIGGHKK